MHPLVGDTDDEGRELEEGSLEAGLPSLPVDGLNFLIRQRRMLTHNHGHSTELTNSHTAKYTVPNPIKADATRTSAILGIVIGHPSLNSSRE